MIALWLEKQSLSLCDIPKPVNPGEALIKIHLSGVCGTDLELVSGYYPFTGVIGHEFVGEVVDAPEKDWIGKRVVGEINVVCGKCEQCRNDRPSHCEKRTVLGIMNRAGVHAEYSTLPLANLHVVPDSVSDEAAVFTEPLAAALEIQEQVNIQPSERVLLVGAGRLGQCIAQTLALTGCKLCVVARYQNQKTLLEARKIRLITEDAIQPKRWDVVVEATGSPSGYDLALRAVRPRGRLVLKSTFKGVVSVNWSSIVVDEVTIMGSRCGPFAPALRLMETGVVDPAALIDGQYPLMQGLEAFNKANEPGVLKILLNPKL